MPVRRCSDPVWVQHIWDAVRFTLHQRQQTDMGRITRYLQRIWDHPPPQSEYHIRQLLQDNLLISENRTGQKGTKVGLITECFKIPPADDIMPEDDGHDWYCIKCHLAGDVTCCTTCHRVFHLSCHNDNNETNESNESNESNEDNEDNESKPKEKEISESDKSVISDTDNGDEPILVDESLPVLPANNKTDVSEVISEGDVSSSAEQTPAVCYVCHLLQNEKECAMGKEELNYLLNFTLSRIKIWLPPNITDTMAPRVLQPWVNEQELRWRANQLLYQTMDIRIMEMKLRTQEYSKLAQFHADVITIQHNVAIFHGKDSQEMDSSKLMLHDCVYDLGEVAQCIDCYRHSNEKSSNSWFCIPCKKPHELVWAKQKGYSYWPAKVIKKTDEQYDVRFFGAKHLRSLVDKNFIKPIEVPLQVLQVKRTQAFNKALQELHFHQNLLANPDEVAKLIVNADNEVKQNEKKSLTGSGKKAKSKKQKVSEDSDVYEFHDSPLDDLDGPLDITYPPPPTTETPKKVDTPKSKTPKRKPKKSLNLSIIDEPMTTRRSNGKDCDIIDISDGESKTLSPSFERHDLVSSSTENMFSQPTLSVEKATTRTRSRRGSSGATQQLDKPYSDAVEKLRRQLETITDREEMIRVSMDTMQQELDRTQNSQSEHLRTMVDAHNVHISEIKKKQWCYNCEQEAIYHCCWNTAYCSTTCQQQHWQSEHKKVCRRKR